MQGKQLSIVNHNLMDLAVHRKQAFRIQYYVDELSTYAQQAIPLHWHSELEFYIAYGGSIDVQAGKDHIVLEDGNAIFINSSVLHSFHQVQDCDVCQCSNIVFSYELLAQHSSIIYQKYVQDILFDSTLPYFILDKQTIWQDDILNLLDFICSLLQKYGETPKYYGQFPILPFQHKEIVSSCFELEVQNYLQQIWKIFYTYVNDLPRISIQSEKQILQIRIQKMIQFIQHNYASPIYLCDIANAAGISKNEAFRCFQSYFQDSPVNYLLKYRIGKAIEQLRITSATVLEISELCGFRSSSYFCKIFHKVTGYTTSQYQRINLHKNLKSMVLIE